MQEQEGQGYNSVIQAARMLQVDPHYVYILIWRGTLKAFKQRGRWRVLGTTLRRFNERRKQK